MRSSSSRRSLASNINDIIGPELKGLVKPEPYLVRPDYPACSVFPCQHQIDHPHNTETYNEDCIALSYFRPPQSFHSACGRLDKCPVFEAERFRKHKGVVFEVYSRDQDIFRNSPRNYA